MELNNNLIINYLLAISCHTVTIKRSVAVHLYAFPLAEFLILILSKLYHSSSHLKLYI